MTPIALDRRLDDSTHFRKRFPDNRRSFFRALAIDDFRSVFTGMNERGARSEHRVKLLLHHEVFRILVLAARVPPGVVVERDAVTHAVPDVPLLVGLLVL